MLVYVYNKLYSYGGGDISLIYNYYYSNTRYISSFDPSGSLNVAYTIPITYNFDPFEFDSVMLNQTCDFLLDVVDGVVHKDYLPILFIFDMKLFLPRILLEFIKQLFIDLSKVYLYYFKEKVINKELYPLFLDSSKDNSELFNQIDEYYNNDDLHTIFLLTTEEKLNYLINSIYIFK